MTSALAITTVDLARWQFALTTLFHFIFVPLTLGLAPLLAVMQTRWHRTGDEKWRRLTRFFGTLFLINFAIGVATGLVMEFQFGMNWSAFSAYVGDVFGPPLAIEGIGAFMLEAVFIGLWVFGWDRLSPRVHLATIYLVWLGTWLSAYFILTANSWMQHPVGYEIDSQTGRAEATDIVDILFQGFVLFAWTHAILAGLSTASFLVLGVSCWHLLRGRNVEVFRSSAKLAIIVVLPATFVQLGVGSEFGVLATDVQPMKISATEALWDTEQPAALLALPDRRVHRGRPDAVVRHRGPGPALVPRDELVQGRGGRDQRAPEPGRAAVRPGQLHPGRPPRVLEHARHGLLRDACCSLLAALGRLAPPAQERLESAKWFQRAALVGIALPFLANFAGWILTEAGRQPWVVYGLLKTEDAVSSSVSTWTVGLSLTVFVSLYVVLGLTDFILMRRYARLDPPEPDGEGSEEAAPPQPAPAF